ncbi:hypothetical protein LZ31DRAFT_158957 [Colletotrichum somersetense]|nr:hypothetical protein LZ31DRAFT_158957 [Colletotrichum somersetense]
MPLDRLLLLLPHLSSFSLPVSQTRPVGGASCLPYLSPRWATCGRAACDIYPVCMYVYAQCEMSEFKARQFERASAGIHPEAEARPAAAAAAAAAGTLHLDYCKSGSLAACAKGASCSSSPTDAFLWFFFSLRCKSLGLFFRLVSF